MSGGGNKKKLNKTQGWEEAGLEFYQESYPSNANEFDVLQQNPKHLATLLPSKQTRTIAATIRIRNNTDTRTFRRQQSMRRESTVRRTSTAAEVQVSMMPDLSQNLSTEETTYQEIMEIKALPIPMSAKKDMKAKLQHEPNLRLQGFEHLKWKRKRIYEQFTKNLNESYKKLQLWRGTLKTIEGNFGTGVVAFFLFIKWLMFLNLFIFSLILMFVIIPMLLAREENPKDCIGERNSTECCTSAYFNKSEDSQVILDIFQGTGYMERTLFFYGPYLNETFVYTLNGTVMYYNLPLAYVIITVLYFLLSLIAIIRSAAHGFKERLVEGEGQFYQYCNMVFGGWDFCIDNEKSAMKKHDAIFNEIKSTLEIERLEEERKSRTRDEKTKLVAIRIIVNFLVITILLAGAAIIYFVFDFSTTQLNKFGAYNGLAFDRDGILRLIYEFLPSISIVLLNLTVPTLFQYLVSFEIYNPVYVVRLTLVRTIFLRLFSLFVLYASLYSKVSCSRNLDECYSTVCKTPMCWETYVGQQMYKLAITDFTTKIIISFIINFIRSRIGLIENKFAKFIGEQSFDLPKHVLDIVYLQTVCWFGSFYAPFLPALFVFILFIMFYVKKFDCLVNSKPSLIVYRASRSKSMFMIVLLVSYIFALIPVAFSISELLPSKSCGPFRGLRSVWETVTSNFEVTPTWMQLVAYFLTTAGFGIPVFIVLSLVLYYYVALNSANRHMVVVLKHQLVLEGHDKQFLLEKLSSFIKQQQQMHKRARQTDMMLREGERNIASN